MFIEGPSLINAVTLNFHPCQSLSDDLMRISTVSLIIFLCFALIYLSALVGLSDERTFTFASVKSVRVTSCIVAQLGFLAFVRPRAHLPSFIGGTFLSLVLTKSSLSFENASPSIAHGLSPFFLQTLLKNSMNSFYLPIQVALNSVMNYYLSHNSLIAYVAGVPEKRDHLRLHVMLMQFCILNEFDIRS